jgi:prephenate dehydratase
VDALRVLSERGLNLTMIQSRPIPGRFDEYRFFIEFDGVPGEGKGGVAQKGAEALEALRAQTHHLSVLGSYPILDLPEQL